MAYRSYAEKGVQALKQIHIEKVSLDRLGGGRSHEAVIAPRRTLIGVWTLCGILCKDAGHEVKTRLTLMRV